MSRPSISDYDDPFPWEVTRVILVASSIDSAQSDPIGVRYIALTVPPFRGEEVSSEHRNRR
jgi:hypothetical protein